MEKKCLMQELAQNAYPGRGIVIGKSEDGTKAVCAYFIMGRSVNSRNRVFVEEGEGNHTDKIGDACHYGDQQNHIQGVAHTLTSRDLLSDVSSVVGSSPLASSSFSSSVSLSSVGSSSIGKRIAPTTAARSAAIT